ncbi:MAG: PqiC family protein [Proteobacteria bacterium]|nr:PqiC family protein [Pseudomonadota bacterium]
MVILAGLIAATGACRSSSSRYYTLVPPAHGRERPSTNDFQIEVLPVDVPADVDRTQLVVRRGSGQLAPIDAETWIAPLSLEIRRALSEDLAQALSARDVATMPGDDRVPTFRIKVAVQRFESTLGDHTLVDATWTIRQAEEGKPLTCAVRVRERAASGYAALVEAHQRGLARIADQIATGLRGLRAGAPVCPLVE